LRHRLKIKKEKKVAKSMEKKIEKNCNKIFIGILIFFVLVLTYKLGLVPAGLHVDEAGMAFDAINLAKNGTDRYANFLPVYLINFGGGQSALYAYLTAFLFLIFGYKQVLIRVPSVILSVISLICLYKSLKEYFDYKYALAGAIVYAFSPWNIMRSRWGLDAYLLASMLIISLYAVLHAIKNPSNLRFLISGILLGLTLYTYALSYIIMFVLVAFIVIYAFCTKKINIKHVFFLGVPLGLLALPLILMLAYNSGILENVNFPIFTIPKLWFYRGAELSLLNVPENVLTIFNTLFIEDRIKIQCFAVNLEQCII
jgi:4-amino-4-deoxy-L-arabinose transferase-like glycosyltransferase